MPLLMSRHNRRTSAVAGAAALALLTLSACGSSKDAPSVSGAGAKAGSDYDKIITSAPVAASGDVDKNAWAKKI